VTAAWREHGEAHEELRASVHWYEDRRERWGDKFADAVESAIDSIVGSPTSWGFYRGIRRTPQVYCRSLAGFPYDIVYLVRGGEVYIVAYAHERRSPGYWVRRIDG
jgi:plasmid stabilization system protein ParE